MHVTHGQVCPNGYLPAYSVDTEEEAKALMAFVPRGLDGEHYAEELFDTDGKPFTGAKRRDAFVRFGLRLKAIHEGILHFQQTRELQR